MHVFFVTLTKHSLSHSSSTTLKQYDAYFSKTCFLNIKHTVSPFETSIVSHYSGDLRPMAGSFGKEEKWFSSTQQSGWYNDIVLFRELHRIKKNRCSRRWRWASTDLVYISTEFPLEELHDIVVKLICWWNTRSYWTWCVPDCSKISEIGNFGGLECFIRKIKPRKRLISLRYQLHNLLSACGCACINPPTVADRLIRQLYNSFKQQFIWSHIDLSFS